MFAAADSAGHTFFACVNYLTQRWAWNDQLSPPTALRDVSRAAGEVVEQAVNGYCSFPSAADFRQFTDLLQTSARQFWEVIRADSLYPIHLDLDGKSTRPMPERMLAIVAALCAFHAQVFGIQVSRQTLRTRWCLALNSW